MSKGRDWALQMIFEENEKKRGNVSSGASAASTTQKEKDSDVFLRSLGIKTNKAGIPSQKNAAMEQKRAEEVAGFSQELTDDVVNFSKKLADEKNDTLLPSKVQGYRTTQKELQKNWNALDLARSQTPNALDLPAHKKVSLTGDVLGRIDNSIEGKERTIGEYTDDMSYVKDKTQSYEDYTRYVQAAMGDEYKGLRGDLYTYGMEKSDTRPEGQMTLDEINSEINALVREITDAKKPREPMRDPMSGMVMPTMPVDVSAQEARLKELYEKLESKDYISSEEAEAAQQSYFDMYREKWGNKMDAQDEQIAEIEDTLRRGYTTDASKPLTSEEYDELLKKQEELQRGMDETKDPILDAYAFGSDEYHITETAGKSVAELIEEKYPGQKTQAQLDGSALAEAAAQENAKLEAEIKQLQAYEGNDGWVADLYYDSERKKGITQRERQIAANERIIRDVEFFQLQSAEDFAKVAEEGKKKIKVLPGAKTIGQYTMRDGEATIDATWNVLTEDEQNTYAYLLETDPEKATEYWKTLTDDTYGVVPKRKTETMQEAVTKFAGQNALTATAATAGRILTAPIRTLWGGGSQIADAITGKEISPYSNAMTMTNYAQSTSEGVQQSIDEATAKSPLLNTLATVGYTAFTSMGDSLMAGLFGPMGLPMMGLDSAQQTVNDALENGATQEEAMTLGGVTGIIEVVTEKIPFDELLGALKGKATTGADTLRSAIKKIFVKSTGASATDAAGEMLAEWLGNTADRLVMGDKSQRERSIQEFLSTHPFATRETAEKEVIKNEWKQIAIAGLSGAISSGLSTTGGGLVNYGIQRKAEKATANGAYNDEQAQKEYADAVAQHFNEGAATTGEMQMEGAMPQTAETPVRSEKPRLNDERAVALTGEETAYEYGLTGRSQEDLQNTLEESGIEMTDAERVSFTKGETQRKQNVQKQVEYIKSLNKGGPNGSRKGTFRSISDAELELFKDRGIRAFNGVFSDKQRAVSNALRGLAETMHMNIVYFESPTDENGNRVGANGFYDRRSNTIYLDVFAGKGNEQAMMRAAAHEVTHVIQEWSPDKYMKLQDKLFKYYYSTGKNTLNEMIQAQKDKAKANGLELTESEALDEVTADACEMMFSDVEAMSEIARTDRTLFEKIGEWINKFVDSIKTAMQGIRSSTKESRLLMESRETWENARKIWYQALEEAGQNNPGSVTETAKTVDQTTEIAENMQIRTADQAESESESQEDVNGKNDPETEAGDVQYSLRGEYPVNEEQAEKNKKIVAGMNSVADLRGDEFAVEKGSRNEVRKYYESLGGEVQNAEIGDVAITWRSIRDALGHGVSKEKMAAFHAVPAVIENGHVINVQKKWKGRELDTAVIAAPITIAGEKYYAGVVVSRPYFSKVQRYYTHEVLIQKERDSAVQNRGPENGALPVGESLTIKSLLDQLRNVKSEDVEANIRYSLRDTEYKTDRELLATALESAAVTEEEKQMLKEYQQIAAKLDADEQRADWIDSEIEKLRQQNPKAEQIQEAQKERDALYRKLNKARKDIAEVENKLTVLKEVEGAEEEKAQLLDRHGELTERIAVQETQLEEIKGNIRKMEKEGVDTEKMEQLKEEKRKAKGEITYADRKLFQMEMLKPIRRIADVQRESAERAARRARLQLKNYKSKAEQEIEEAKTRLDDYREGVIQREYIGKIKRTSDRLAKWLTKPNNQRYVPEDLRRPLAEFLLAIDRGSETMLTGGGMTQKDRDYARVVDDLRRVIESINKYQMGDETADVDINMHFDLPHGFSEMMADMVEMLQAKREALGENLTLNRMNSEELENLYKVLVAINTSIIRANEFLSTANTKHVDEVAEKSIAYLNDQKERRVKLPGADFITWTNTQPIYAFERFGEGGKQIFKMLQNGQSKLAYNTKKILEAAKKIYTSKQVRKWLKEKKTFTINGKEITIPVTHIMSLYCISKRAQGQTHLYGDGIRLADVKKGPVTIQGAQMRTTEADVQRIIGSLTQEQRQVADAMQKLMSTLGAQWGNEVSMKRFGFRMFTEQHYFPLRTVSESRTAKADGETGNELYRLLNISSTKPIIKGAKNMILLDNIFDVFATHMSDMAQYNALALPVLDAVKWLNYKEVEEVTGEEGETKKLFKDSVRNAARIAYGDVANKYIMRLLKDVNGAQMTGGEDSIGLKMIGRQNRAAVAGNMRVVMLQPLSIIRAGMVLGDMSVIKGLALGPVHIKKNFREMEEYSGIAVWKELGFYDVNISRGVKQMIKNDSGVTDKTIEKLMAPAGIADHVTWALMWEATKRKVKKTMNPSQEGYMEKVAETFEEVVYKTQVVDSVLTKSQYMRGKSFWSKMSSSFMSEPTTTYNMVMDAHYKLLQDMKSSQKKGIGKFQEAWMKNKNGKRLLHTISIFTMSALVSTMIEQLFSAYRDEDDYETFMEKYVDGALDTFINNMVLVNKLPVLKDVWETGKTIAAAAGVDTYGYENETVIGSITSNLEKAVEIYADLKEGNPTNYTEWGMTYKGLQAFSDVSGVPFSGVAREVTALYNNVIAPMTGRKIVVYQTGKSYGYQQLYEAIQSGNTERESVILAELHENGADDKEIESGLRKLAKEDYIAGNMTDKEAIAFLKKYDKMTEKEAYWKLEEWGWEGEDEDEKFSVYSELEDALLEGKGIDAAITKLTTHGYEKNDVQSRIRSIIKDAYLDGDLSKNKVESYLKKYGGVKTDNEIWFKLQQYEYERLTKESTSSDVCMVFYAIDQKKSPANEISAAIRHGKTKEGIASSLTSHYKPQYLEMLKTNKSAAYQLATRLAGIFDYLGYEGTKKVQGWTETK